MTASGEGAKSESDPRASPDSAMSPGRKDGCGQTTTSKDDDRHRREISLRGEDLWRVSASIRPILAGLKNGAVTFCQDGAIVQGSLCGQRVFVPLLAEDFTAYEWKGSPAVFLSATDSRKGLLDAFKNDRKKAPCEVTFAVEGSAPSRSVTQTVVFPGDGEQQQSSASTIKHELWSSITAYPCSDPDVSFRFNKQQMGKVAAVAGRIKNETLTFALKPEGGFYVGNVGEVVRFDVSGTNMVDYPYSAASCSVLRFLTKNGKTQVTMGPSSDKDRAGKRQSQAKTRQSSQKSLTGSGSGKPFCLALEDTAAFKAMFQKIRIGSGGMDLSFYTSTSAPMMRIRLITPASPSVFLFCTSDCVPMHELEAVSAVAGSVSQRPQSTIPFKKRTAHGRECEDRDCSVQRQEKRQKKTQPVQSIEKKRSSGPNHGHHKLGSAKPPRGVSGHVGSDHLQQRQIQFPPISQSPAAPKCNYSSAATGTTSSSSRSDSP